jgi:hypothetical protein
MCFGLKGVLVEPEMREPGPLMTSPFEIGAFRLGRGENGVMF